MEPSPQPSPEFERVQHLVLAVERLAGELGRAACELREALEDLRPSRPPARRRPVSGAPQKRLHTVKEVAEMLAIGRTRIFELMHSDPPQLESVLIGGSRRIPKEAIDAFLSRQRDESLDERAGDS